MLKRCAEAIRAQGWPVEDRRYKLVVQAPGTGEDGGDE
jgi:hypothetical protein